MSERPRESLVRATLVSMGLRIALVIVALTLVSYWQVLESLETQTLEQLEKYAVERGQRESDLFKLTQDNHFSLRDEFTSRYREMGNHDPVTRFESLFEAWEDGTLRTRSQLFYGVEQGNGAVSRGISGFVGQDATLTPAGRRRLVITYDLLNTYGPAWRSRFPDLYISMFDNMGLIYWPEVPWDLEAPADFDMTQEAWFYLAEPGRNPSRQSVWTGIYYDDVAQEWMVSCLTPIDYEGRHIATIGGDVLLTGLLKRTVENRLEGTYNLIFREDGLLIVHPDRMADIQAQGGFLDVHQAGDAHLWRIFERVQGNGYREMVIENAADDEYIAVTHIEGPEWYFVTIFPRSLITGTALRTARLVLLLGLLTMLIEILLLFFVLRRRIARPLQEFVGVAGQIAAGSFDSAAVSSLPVEREDEIGVLAQAVRDMARQLQETFALLQSSEQKYRRLFEDSNDAILITTPDGHLLDVNRAGEDFFGYSKAELQSLTVQDVYVFPQDRERFRYLLEEDGQVDNFETRFYRRDGAMLTVLLSATVQRDEEGRVTAFQTIIRDITERKRAQEEREQLLTQVQAQAQRVQQIVDTVPEGVLLLDAEESIVLMNPMARKNLVTLADIGVGDTLVRLGDRSLTDLLTSPPQGLWHDVEADEQSFQVIARSLEIGPMPGGWVLVIRDVTQMQEVERRIHQQEKLASVGQLAAGIAHDFNNIMATVLLYAQMTAREEGLSERVRNRMLTIEQQARHAANLIRQILDFSRRSVLARRPLNLLSFLKEQVQLLERTLPENIQVKFVRGPGDDEAYIVNADLTSMQQMVMNLAINARDAMPMGGSLRVELARVTLRSGDPLPVPEMDPLTSAVSHWIRVRVSDTGTGIPPDVLPRIFEPFFTTRAPLGSGLGLSQVHGIVGSHGGYIGVETEVDLGTTFSIYLPALMEEPAESQAITGGTQRALPTGQGEVILVVEDDSVSRRALVDSLEQLKYRTVEAANGRKALDILAHSMDKETADPISLVLSDVVMPELGGIALLHAIRNQGWAVRIVLLTGHPLGEELERLQVNDEEEGVLVGWMLKPPSMEQLAAIVARGLGKGTGMGMGMGTDKPSGGDVA